MIGLAVILAGLAGPPAWAGELIRVGLSIDVETVILSGPPAARLSAPGNPSVAEKLPNLIQISASPKGLILNGRATSFDELTFSAPDGVLKVGDFSVGGILQIRLTQGRLRVINILDIEDYLKGVVPVEVSPKWHPELLKVQAIISRTYALNRKRANPDKEFDLLATTGDQVYAGRSKEDPAANLAIAETAGWVLTYEGQVILAAFHSTSAGSTESASAVWGLDIPYLKGASCPFDQGSPYYRWTRSLPMETVQDNLAQAGYSVGTIATITPFRKTPAGRVDQVRILHSRGQLILKAPELRRILGYTELRSTQFEIEKMSRDLMLRGMGSGHAVGLCQWGAKEMAEMGYRAEDILGHYYPGVRLERAEAVEIR